MKPIILFVLAILLLISCSTTKTSKTFTTNLADTTQVVSTRQPEQVQIIEVVDTFLYEMMKGYAPILDSAIAKRTDWKVQIIYTQIDRQSNGTVEFTDHTFHLYPQTYDYIYPASTVKLPVAALALQRLHELNIPGLDMNSTMINDAKEHWQTGSYNDPTTADGRPTIAQFIRKILLVSDNDAFNRLYEFLGQDYINQQWEKMEMVDAAILHRLDVSLPIEHNRITNPILFLDSSGKLLYQQPQQTSRYSPKERISRLGKGYMKGGKLINEPMDFTFKNRFPLQDLNQVLKSLLFPGSMPPWTQFNLDSMDYVFLRRYMSMDANQSTNPTYKKGDYRDMLVKEIVTDTTGTQQTIKVYRKTGGAYGFLLDNAYIVDTKNNIEFMVTASIYCNSDGILNDDKYDYATIGYPFFAKLGKLLYEYELKRERKISGKVGVE